MSKSAYSIMIDGTPVTSNFAPVLISLTITDSEGGKSDTLEIELDDSDGQIAFPRCGADIEARLWWIEPPLGAPAGEVVFKGKTDEPTSDGTRGGGMTMTINAKSADPKGRSKNKEEKHKDDATFGDVAQEWGKSAGLDIKVDEELAAIKRDWWAMANESYLQWGARIAAELGATFKIQGGQGVFVARNSGKSASGQALPAVTATRGVNLISWSLSPAAGAPQFKTAKVRWYDRVEAKFKTESVDIKGADADADLTETLKAGDQGRAKTRAKANGEDSKSEKGGGDVTLDGNPLARSRAPLNVVGARPGIDGPYRIKTATHTYKRDAGWTTKCSVEQPDGKTGKDARKKS